MNPIRAIGAGFLSAAALVALGAVPADAADAPPTAATPEAAASAPATLDTLSRFFARDGVLARSAARPRVEGVSVPVRVLSPEFVAGKAGAPVARVEFHASRAVASDGQTASLWTARQADGGWQVVNIATGDDEVRYAGEGAKALPGGIVFREPQIDAWYVQKGAKVLPLDEDAVRAAGQNGTSLTAYRDRVARAYGDKLPGSAYARKGTAGGYDTPAAADDEPLVTAASATAGAGAALALGLIGTRAWRRRRPTA
ncbi:hypothetical protein Q5762_05230 [Streptomyces sp. P9(2023)]|uniref:hypothetical protein n=1 Tax=Streptomyces sp. P9(2023) TaxID=3064394 RepID=UPI0028F41B8B|nr:hypothetical protein [Streptomyces sp. P9(2023)]MDT9687760.1 hypothetical protein [Streptomyces sp. P9(2023)]